MSRPKLFVQFITKAGFVFYFYFLLKQTEQIELQEARTEDVEKAVGCTGKDGGAVSTSWRTGQARTVCSLKLRLFTRRGDWQMI